MSFKRAVAATVVTAFLSAPAAPADARPAPSAAAAAAAAAPRTVEAWVKDGKPRAYPTRLLEDLRDYRPVDAVKLDRYGGWVGGPKLKATGFFRAERVGQRWWLVTPDGNPYLSIALTSLKLPKNSESVMSAFRAKFGGDEAAWREHAIALMRGHGFNGTGSFSDDAAFAASPNRLPYSTTLNFMSRYGKVRGGTYQKPGHTGYPNDCPFVFDDAFPEHCDATAREAVAKLRDDPYLIGYYSDNELPFRADALDRYLTNPEGDPGRRAAEAFVKSRGDTASSIDDADRQAWVEFMADRYFAVTSAAIRKYDPNHLFLGSRFHGADLRNAALFRAAGRHVDVISYNLYHQWTPDAAMLRRWAEWSGRPVMITEFYAKGVDSGMANTGGAGFTVATQAERGMFYENFTLGLLESGVCVGWHWLRYIDNATDDRSADPSNRDSNKGVVDATFAPYAPVLAAMKRLNAQAYPLARYFDARPVPGRPAADGG